MKYLTIVFLSIALVTCTIQPVITQTSEKNYPERLRRADSFLGIHFDFHAGDDCTEIGKYVTREMIESIIDQVHPDYLQCDCKGHRGLSSYPTKVGNPAPGFVRDQLRIWREVTAERGVALYLHYSGVWDIEAVAKHPEWARIDENGKIDPYKISVFGAYVDSLLIPQLKELNDVYGVDGVWIDGDCWATERDYGETPLKLFREKTGITTVPRKPDDPYYFEFSEFCRDGFKNYLNHYVTELHTYAPKFQIASNWSYSSMMPEPVTINVDFISGDFSARNSVNTARLEGRCFVNQGKPWDLMAWSFSWLDGNYSLKSAVQLKQEAAVVLSVGGGFQAYFQQKRDGSVRLWQMTTMGEVAKFCRERQAICHHAQPVPQIGIIYPSDSYYHKNKALFIPFSIYQPLLSELIPMSGILQCLLASQNSVEIVMKHHLTGRMREYPLLVYPEWEYVDPTFRDSLLTYVREGGNLIVIGPKSAAHFKKEIDVTFVGEPKKCVVGLEHNGIMAGLNTQFQKVALGKSAKPFGKIYGLDTYVGDNDMMGNYEIPASITQYGKGKIAAVYINFGERYWNSSTAVARDFLNGIVRELFPDPIVTVDGSHAVDVAVNRIRGKLAVNLVNTSGQHSNALVNVFDEIPPVGPLTVTIKSPTKPRNVTVEPEGKKLKYNYSAGKISLVLPKLDIHDIIVVEE